MRSLIPKNIRAVLRKLGFLTLLWTFIGLNVGAFCLDVFDIDIEEKMELSEDDSTEKEGEEKEKEKEEIKDSFVSNSNDQSLVESSRFRSIHDISILQLVCIDIPTPPPDRG